MTDKPKPKMICLTCKKEIIKGEGYLSIVDDKDWDPSESAYDLLTKPKKWNFYHTKC